MVRWGCGLVWLYFGRQCSNSLRHGLGLEDMGNVLVLVLVLLQKSWVLLLITWSWSWKGVATASALVLEDMVLVSRRIKDLGKSLGLATKVLGIDQKGHADSTSVGHCMHTSEKWHFEGRNQHTAHIVSSILWITTKINTFIKTNLLL